MTVGTLKTRIESFFLQVVKCEFRQENVYIVPLKETGMFRKGTFLTFVLDRQGFQSLVSLVSVLPMFIISSRVAHVKWGSRSTPPSFHRLWRTHAALHAGRGKVKLAECTTGMVTSGWEESCAFFRWKNNVSGGNFRQNVKTCKGLLLDSISGKGYTNT